jgi:hypothetical protein
MQVDGSTYSITHPDPDLELDGWLRCSIQCNRFSELNFSCLGAFLSERRRARSGAGPFPPYPTLPNEYRALDKHFTLNYNSIVANIAFVDAVSNRQENVVAEDGAYSTQVAAALQVPARVPASGKLL